MGNGSWFGMGNRSTTNNNFYEDEYMRDVVQDYLCGVLVDCNQLDRKMGVYFLFMLMVLVVLGKL